MDQLDRRGKRNRTPSREPRLSLSLTPHLLLPLTIASYPERSPSATLLVSYLLDSRPIKAWGDESRMNRGETQGDGGKTAVSGPSSGPQKEVRPRLGLLFHEPGCGWGIFPPQPPSLGAAERISRGGVGRRFDPGLFQRSGRPGLDVGRSRIEGSSTPLGTRVVQGVLLGYEGV